MQQQLIKKNTERIRCRTYYNQRGTGSFLFCFIWVHRCMLQYLLRKLEKIQLNIFHMRLFIWKNKRITLKGQNDPWHEYQTLGTSIVFPQIIHKSNYLQINTTKET
jgi:hypothetical protein